MKNKIKKERKKERKKDKQEPKNDILQLNYMAFGFYMKILFFHVFLSLFDWDI